MPFDLIHTRSPNDDFLSLEQVKTTCPAAFTDHASPETSERYGFVSSADAIDILADHGFRPTSAKQKPARNHAMLPYCDHMLTFRPVTGYSDETETMPEIILYNSHNGKSALKLYAGAFRFVCSNGLMAGDGFQARMRHSRLTADGFSDMVHQQGEGLPSLMERIERMKITACDIEQAIDFTYNAAKLRWDMLPQDYEYRHDLRGSFADDRTVRNMQLVRRYGDAGLSLWHVFNRAQETLIKGGVDIVSITDRKPYPRYRAAKGVASLAETVRINRSLWDMAEDMAA